MKTERCNCGSLKCTRTWLIGAGIFVKGSGFTSLEAIVLMRLWNQAKGRLIPFQVDYNAGKKRTEVHCALIGEDDKLTKVVVTGHYTRASHMFSREQPPEPADFEYESTLSVKGRYMKIDVALLEDSKLEQFITDVINLIELDYGGGE